MRFKECDIECVTKTVETEYYRFENKIYKTSNNEQPNENREYLEIIVKYNGEWIASSIDIINLKTINIKFINKFIENYNNGNIITKAKFQIDNTSNILNVCMLMEDGLNKFTIDMIINYVKDNHPNMHITDDEVKKWVIENI